MELKRRVPSEPIAHKYPCPVCGHKGIVDFIDLVRGRSQLHCQSCSEIFTEEAEATMAHLID